MQHMIKRYGWIHDLPDHRDLLYSAPMATLATLPSKVDMRDACPAVYDQGQLGSCTGNAIGGAMEFDLKKENPSTEFAPSRLFIYYNERVIEGTVQSDSGAQIRDGIKSVASQGAPHEALWPYDISKFEDKPSQAAYDDAMKHEATLYQRLVQSLTQMKGCLAAGNPFVFGFTVYASFESPEVAKTGVVPMPARHEKVLGGHAVLAVGYDDSQQRFIVRNSWGTAWGEKGYFTIPYTYLLDSHLSSDFWTIKFVK
jgi:C1A family cysteine protease